MNRKRGIAPWMLVFALCTAPLAAAAAESGEAPAPDRLMFGAGWPDLRLRGQLWRSLDLEAKVATDGAVLAYGGRLYWRAWSHGMATLIAGAEGGAFSFSGVEGLDGSGSYAEPFIGAQLRFAPRWNAQVDLGPAFMTTQSSGLTLSTQPWVANAAIYFTLL